MLSQDNFNYPKESKKLLELNNDYIAKYYDVFYYNGFFCILSEYCEVAFNFVNNISKRNRIFFY